MFQVFWSSGVALGQNSPISSHISAVSPKFAQLGPDLVKIVLKCDQNTRVLTPNLKYFDTF
jgi:hypothetical protein